MKRRAPGALYAVLAVSIALNLAAAGYFGVTRFHSKSPPRTVETTIGFISSRYPPSVGAVIREKLEARRDELAQALQEMKDARRATRDTMSQAPLDRAQVDAAFANARVKAANFQKVIHEAITEALPAVPEADRAKIDRGDPD